MRLLLTNDDGIRAIGLRSLEKALRRAGHQVMVVAPLSEQSAVGHAVTLSSPLRLKEINDGDFQGVAVSGTPVDCVKIGLNSILSLEPDLVVSGINNGANVGVDILYSGTVAAATEAALAGIPALAVSIDDFHPLDLEEQAEFVARFIEVLDPSCCPPQRVLNLNFPKGPFEESRGLRICPQTQAVYDDRYEQRTDPRGNAYYWLSGEIPAENLERDTDRDLLSRGYLTLTPLRFDFSDRELIVRIKELEETFPPGR
ncbi:MAG: 5'/3'-nucleotidase SurE [Desulfohalobiaceae bacterium]|nr:5'/3'-nucleotidase SurE [Desulfohalobiaceae bacterium]